MIIDVRPSPLKYKRYRATILKDNGEEMKIDFGLKGGSTYIDGDRSNKERENYLKRHLANKTENTLINNLIPSPSLLSAYLLWGPSKNLERNVNELNKLWKEKHR
jgi:hypothetical protein